MKPRYTPPDANQGDIVKALLQIPGVDVIDLREVGNDCPDILIGYESDNYLIELKTEKGKVKPGQQRHYDEWPGQTAIARSLDDVLMIIGIEHE